MAILTGHGESRALDRYLRRSQRMDFVPLDFIGLQNWIFCGMMVKSFWEKESDHEEKASYTGYLPCAGRDPGLGSGRRRFPVRFQECCPARDGTFLFF